jgi:Fur family transcriptional regulator, ferric uptake regulator
MKTSGAARRSRSARRGAGLESKAMTAAAKRSGWASEAEAALAEAGHRRGGARMAIIELLDEQHCALTAAEIQEKLQRRGREASRASIYRVMEELENIGLLDRVEVGQGTSSRYEPARGAAEHHHHIVCERCGRLEPFSDAGLERAIERVSERLSVEVSEHEIVLRGACRSCAA